MIESQQEGLSSAQGVENRRSADLTAVNPEQEAQLKLIAEALKLQKGAAIATLEARIVKIAAEIRELKEAA